MTASSSRPARIYAIADVEMLGLARVPDAISAMADAGVRTIQLRAKQTADDELTRLCDELFERLHGHSVSLWIDDRVDVALLRAFDGVHLGQRDLSPSAARSLLPASRAIGWSTHDRRQVVAGAADPAVDWLAIGPVFATESKADPEPEVGLAGVAEARRLSPKPLVAIGGIDEGNLCEVLAAGADSVAVLSAICRGDVAKRAHRLLRAAGGGA